MNTFLFQFIMFAPSDGRISTTDAIGMGQKIELELLVPPNPMNSNHEITKR